MVEAVRIRNMTKSFEGVTVLDGVNLDIEPGEVRGLIGENGSGKSTLVKILSGMYAPDPGSSCELWGEATSFPIHAQRHGMATIHQDLGLVDHMSVTENIGITSGYDSRVLIPFNKKRQEELARSLSREFGLQLDPRMPVGQLAPAERSVVAIVRALRVLRKSQENHVVIMDEPTAALPFTESERLLGILRNLAAGGAAVLFISHRLQEVLGVCDRISVLRAGKLVGTVDRENATDARLLTMMLGYELGEFYPEKNRLDSSNYFLQVRSLAGGNVEGVTFGVAPGEIVGITGLAGMGQDELPYLIDGYAHRSSGTVVVDGKIVAPSVTASLKAGMVLVPGNRQRDAIWINGTAAENLTLPFLREFQHMGMLNRPRELRFARSEMARFDVRPLRPAQKAARFSGGNQQKLVVARWLKLKPRVLMLHEPTQGVDPGAKKEILAQIRHAAEAGTAVAMFSSDVEEVANMCDRALIMRHGRITGEIGQGLVSQERLVVACQDSNQRIMNGSCSDES
jgi:ribose transport system ATP-binding protein